MGTEGTTSTDLMATAMQLWSEEKTRRGIQGKPDFSNVIAGVCRCLKLNPTENRAELKKALKDWADAYGAGVSDRTIRNWIAGEHWSEKNAAMAVNEAAKSIAKKNISLALTAMERVPGPVLHYLDHPEKTQRYADTVRKTNLELYRIAFELCIIGDIDGGEYNELLTDVILKVSDLESNQLRALLSLLRAFFPDSDGGGIFEETPSAKVQQLYEVVDEIREWAIQRDEATGEGSCLDPGFTIPPEIIEELRASQNQRKTR